MRTGWLTDFIALIYPHLCVGCNKTLLKHENCLCSYCKISLPVTNFQNIKDNDVSKLFWGRAPIENATAYCFFKKGDRIQKILHQLKYRGNANVGVELGELLGNTLKNAPNYVGIDEIVPVPLHKKRERKRGFNQAEKIGEGIAKAMQIPLNTKALLRLEANETQTKKTHYERWKNVEHIFTLSSLKELENKHVLLVDDVVTTGSTLESCALTLAQTHNIKVSIAVIACA